VKAAIRRLWHRLTPAQRERVQRSRVARALYRNLWAPPGHFYSPYPDVDRLARRSEPSSYRGELVGIDLRADEQRALVVELAALPLWRDIPVDPDASWRYSLDNTPFAYSDGVFLAMMLLWAEPARVLEVGSGWSTLLSLDVRDRCTDHRFELTVVDPFPDARVRAEDDVQIVASPVQDVAPAQFAALEAGDVLFIDSTHVMKAESDVNHLLFDVLPRLAPGVVVHMHDIHWPFEYPDSWLLGGRAWSEAYGLRAFLTGNDDYEILLWPSYLFYNDPELLREVVPPAAVNLGGGSIWIRRR
jgi:Methyltransferase domain